jgi:hypothetical protein
MKFGKVYPLYVAKAERKGRTREEVVAGMDFPLPVDVGIVPDVFRTFNGIVFVLDLSRV